MELLEGVAWVSVLPSYLLSARWLLTPVGQPLDESTTELGTVSQRHPLEHQRFVVFDLRFFSTLDAITIYSCRLSAHVV